VAEQRPRHPTSTPFQRRSSALANGTYMAPVRPLLEKPTFALHGPFSALGPTWVSRCSRHWPVAQRWSIAARVRPALLPGTSFGRWSAYSLTDWQRSSVIRVLEGTGTVRCQTIEEEFDTEYAAIVGATIDAASVANLIRAASDRHHASVYSASSKASSTSMPR
jgi:hypothetical protein